MTHLLFLCLFLGAVGSSRAQGTQQPQAEEVGKDTCVICHDTFEPTLKTTHSAVECESCHGPGSLHVEGGGGDPEVLSFKQQGSDWVNSQCLGCHETGEHLSGFKGSQHAREGFSCVSCHQMHPDQGENARLPLSGLLISSHNETCVSCHKEVEASFRKPYHHPVLEGAFRCTSCHNPHQGDVPSLRSLALGTETNCVSCHSEKRGPFVFEHASLEIAGCNRCHQPHGSINPKMLVRAQVSQLCLECHSMTAGVAALQPPAFHDIRSARYRNCTTCHREIHGSNASSVFLR